MKLANMILKALPILFVISFWACTKSAKIDNGMTSVIVDSTRDIELSVPDSLSGFELENAKVAIGEYFDQSDRFYLDTFSILSERSFALNDKAQKLRQKLAGILPKISLTTGIGENKFMREYYIIEGDIKVDSYGLLLYCKKRIQQIDSVKTSKGDGRKLTVAADLSGSAAIWPSGTTIKYCIMRSSFATKALYDNVVRAMSDAANDWMKVCNVRFEYLSNLDNQTVDVESSSEPVLFVVRQINANGGFIAQAFFPSDPTYERTLLVENSFFTSPFDKIGVLRHELGHILGFRHEHIWSADASCSGEEIIEGELSVIQQTAYDPYSVMHYPCGQNKNNKTLALTDFDKEGARKVYPFP